MFAHLLVALLNRVRIYKGLFLWIYFKVEYPLPLSVWTCSKKQIYIYFQFEKFEEKENRIVLVPTAKSGSSIAVDICSIYM